MNPIILESDHCKVEFIQGSMDYDTGTKITTLVLEYPRAIHSQLLTHRVFSKNSSSSRAVPAKKAIKQIQDNPAQYIWTENQKGMQGPVITDEHKLAAIEKLWSLAMSTQIKIVEQLTDPEGLNVHKQNACRLLEPYQNIRVCLTSTEWDNWDWLRKDEEAQGEIDDLAHLIYEARRIATKLGQYPLLRPGEYHVPFVKRIQRKDGMRYYDNNGNQITLDEAIMISMSCAAQTSYRNLDASLIKAEDIYSKLFDTRKVHASPSEHQATPIAATHRSLGFVRSDGKYRAYHEPQNWPAGVTHVDANSEYWSGNFRNWIQNRQLIPNHDAAKGNYNDTPN